MVTKNSAIRRFLIVRIGPLVSRLHRRFASRRVKILGKTYNIHKGVYNPKFLGISAFMAENINPNPDSNVLDVGTGCGILAITAAEKAKNVVALDRDPTAVRCARENAKQNGIENIVVLEGDLFSPLDQSSRFDVILIHPPFPMGKKHSENMDSENDYRYAFARRFFEEAVGYLKPKGYIQMVYPSFASPEIVVKIAHEAGWNSEVINTKKGRFGKFCIYKFQRT